MDVFLEIEKKYRPAKLPDDLETYPHYEIVQQYLSRNPAVRVRKSQGHYRLTIKSGGKKSHEERNFDLGTEEAFTCLLEQCEGRRLYKTRYLLPVDGYPGLVAELDVFSGNLEGLVILEVEFADEKSAEDFRPPAWFGPEVTDDRRYHNSWLCLEDDLPPF